MPIQGQSCGSDAPEASVEFAAEREIFHSVGVMANQILADHCWWL